MWLFILLRLSRQKLSNFVELLADSDTVKGTRRAMAFQKILAFIGIILLVRYFSGSTYYTRLVIYSLYLPQKRFVVRAHFGQSIFSFFQQKRKKDILLILIIFAYFKVQKKREKKKMVSKIDHFFIFLILKSASKIQKYCKRLKEIFCYFLFFCYC